MRLRTFATVTVTVLALTACGGSEGEEAEPTASAPSTTAPEPTESEKPDEGAESQGETQTYVVKKGDTLSEIAERFKTTVKAIVRLNNLKDANSIKIGQKLKIPAGG